MDVVCHAHPGSGQTNTMWQKGGSIVLKKVFQVRHKKGVHSRHNKDFHLSGLQVGS